MSRFFKVKLPTKKSDDAVCLPQENLKSSRNLNSFIYFSATKKVYNFFIFQLFARFVNFSRDSASFSKFYNK
uniref:Ribosomal protein L32 n=1 Tax=Panagrolaimus sp. JU765 TaxID=591449 RepID=A0AC34RDH6_9BILA